MAHEQESRARAIAERKISALVVNTRSNCAFEPKAYADGKSALCDHFAKLGHSGAAGLSRHSSEIGDVLH